MLQTYTASQVLAPSSSVLFEEVVQLITSSFTDDPGTKWLFTSHTQSEYVASLPHYFRFLVRAALQVGATIVVSREDAPSGSEEFSNIASSPTSRIQAAAILIPPSGNAKMNTTPNVLRAGFLGLIWRCGPRFIWKLLTGLVPAMEAVQVRMHPNPVERNHHFTVLFLAARPDMQGKGLGRKILIELQRIVSEAAKATEIVKGAPKDGKDGSSSLGPAPLYLEASTPTSKRLYERVGFVQQDTLIYGKLNEDNGKDLDIRDNGEVIGGRMFAMLWSPL